MVRRVQSADARCSFLLCAYGCACAVAPKPIDHYLLLRRRCTLHTAHGPETNSLSAAAPSSTGKFVHAAGSKGGWVVLVQRANGRNGAFVGPSRFVRWCERKGEEGKRGRGAKR